MPVKKSSRQNEFHHVRIREHVQQHGMSMGATATGEGDTGRQHAVRHSYFVPTLVSLCADVISGSFSELPDVDGLSGDHAKLYDTIIERLPADLPLSVSVPRVNCEGFWRRCCEARWSFGQLTESTCGKLIPPMPGGWKQFYLERMLSDYLTSLNSPEPATEDLDQLKKLCALCSNHVRNLELACQVTRFDLYECLLSQMPYIERLRLTFGVSNVGTSFDWKMIGFTEADVLNVRFALRMCTSLHSLLLPNNRLDDLLLKGILSGLVHNNFIRVLDLSSNRIGDTGIQQLALLLCKQEPPLEELYLQENCIRGEGAVALGDALALNTTLRVLNLRLNCIPDQPGGVALIAGIASHTALEVLDISHNALGEASAKALADMLPRQNSLLSLNIAGNRLLGENTGELLLEAMSSNTTLHFFDARCTGLGKEFIVNMEAHVQNVVQASRAKKLEAMEEEQRTRIQHQVNEKLEKTFQVL